MPKIAYKEERPLLREGRRRIVSLVTTKNCNLNCDYCYEKNRETDGKWMEFEIAKEKITKYMTEENEKLDGVEIEFFGGEPMLAFPLIQDIVEWFYSKKWNKGHIFMISSNGTILTEEMKEWLNKFRKTVVVAFSIDGNKISHDLSRSNSYDAVLKNIPFFKKNWPTQSAKMTIGEKNIPHVADSIINLEKMGLYFTSNLVLDDIWGDNESKEKLLSRYEEQLEILVDYYINNSDLHPVYPLLSSLPDYLGLPDKGKELIASSERFCGAGHEMVAIDIDGEEYPCHRFIPWIAGRDIPKNKQLNCHKSWKPDQCQNCKVVISCPTCAGNNWEENGDTSMRTTYHCDAYKLECLAAARIEANRLSKVPKSVLKSFPDDEKYKIQKKIDAIYDLLENGI